MRSWIRAMRLRTLPLALSSVGMGGGLALRVDAFDIWIFAACVSVTVFLQILSNLANDYGDSVHGADSAYRTGPQRTVQSGHITPVQMQWTVGATAALSLVSGVWLLWLSLDDDVLLWLLFLGLGSACIAAAILYTVGKRPYGYMGLGDAAVFLFFGPVGVLGSEFLFSHSFAWENMLPAASCGFFSVGVLNLNNLRDIESDRLAHKKSLPVRFGRAWGIWYHAAIIYGGLAAATTYMALTYETPLQFLFLLSVPLFAMSIHAARKLPPQEIDPWLRQLALSTLLFVVLFVVGLSVV